MANADFFNCARCTVLVEVQNIKQEVFVGYDKRNNGWRIICDTCAANLGFRGIPHMRISYDILKEKISHGATN